MKLPLDQIEPNHLNPNEVVGDRYEQLKRDMEAYGQREPITVSPAPYFYGTMDADNTYEDPENWTGFFILCDGEHRLKVAQELGWETIDADVVELTEDEAVTRFYRQQATRGTNNPYKEAELFEHEVKENGLTEQEAADKYNVTRGYVSGRRMLIKTSEAVRELYEKPEAEYRKIAERTLREEIQLGPESEGDPVAEDQLEAHIQSELEEVAPRGALTPGHLRAIASLPNKDQEEIARAVVGLGLTVRDVEEEVRERKEKQEKQRRFVETWMKAKVKNCPKCNSPATGIPTDWNDKEIPNTFRCANGHTWRYDKTPEELEEEAKAKHYEKIEEMIRNLEHANLKQIKSLFYGGNDIRGRGKSDRMVDLFLEDHPEIELKPAPTKADKMNETRQNPGYIKHLWDTAKINEKIGAWVHTKVMELTEIKTISVRGLRGDNEEVTLSWEPPGTYVKGDLTFAVGRTEPIEAEGAEGARNIISRNRFRLDVEAKDYKSGHKSRIDLPGATATEEEREAVIRFLEEITETDLDPWDDPESPIEYTLTPVETKAQPLEKKEPEIDYSPGVIECPSCHKMVPMTPYCINCTEKLPGPEEIPEPEELVEDEPTIPIPDHGRDYQEEDAPRGAEEEPPFGYPASKAPQGELEEEPNVAESENVVKWLDTGVKKLGPLAHRLTLEEAQHLKEHDTRKGAKRHLDKRIAELKLAAAPTPELQKEAEG